MSVLVGMRAGPLDWGRRRARSARLAGSGYSAAAFRLLALRIAAHTACGVAGIGTSSGPIASVIALITAGGAAIAPASPQPLMPSGLEGQRRLGHADIERGQVVRPRHLVVHVGRRHELAVLVVDGAFHQRLADALGDAAMHLALDDHRVDQLAEIVDRRPFGDLGDAGLGIDLDLADVHAGREGEVGRVVEGALLQAGLEVLAGELVGDIGLQRDLAEGQSLVGAGDGEAAVLELDVAFRRLPARRRRPSCPWR